LAQRIDSVAAELATFTSEDDERREWMEATERELPELDRAVATAQAGCEEIDKQIATLREQSVSTEATIAGLAGREEDIAASIAALEEQWKAAVQPAPSESPDGDSILAKLEVARSEYDATTRNLADAMERFSIDATLAERL